MKDRIYMKTLIFYDFISFINEIISLLNNICRGNSARKLEASHNEEIEELEKNEMWELLSLLPVKKKVGGKRVHTVKYERRFYIWKSENGIPSIICHN